MADDAIELQRRARRRLVGAIALVVFVVIVLPIIFDREPKPISQDLTIQIPSQDAGRFATRVLPAAESKADLKSPVDVAAKDDASKQGVESVKSTASVSTQPVTIPEKPGTADKADRPGELAKAGVTQSSPEAAKAPAAKSEAPRQPVESKAAASSAKVDGAAAAAVSESFVIPLGLFRNPENVKKVRGWVSSAGLNSFTEGAPDGDGAKGSAVKVMAGPFPSRDAAEKAREKLKAKGVDVGAVASR